MRNSVFIDEKCIDIMSAKKKCDNYKCISFDVFDTLVKRNIDSARDIFDVLGDLVVREFNISQFDEVRINVERAIRSKRDFVTIDEIYDELKVTYPERIVDRIKDLEIDIEIKYCQPNYDVMELYKYCKDNGKRIVAISDMYLTTEIVKQILENCGYFCDEVYVSCDCKHKKRDGTLFQYVLEKEKLGADKIIHIGDNWKADYIGARKCYINSIHIRNKVSRFNTRKFENSIEDKKSYKHYLSLINNNILILDSFYEKFGFSILGPLIYNYCLWLEERCLKNNIQKVYFFARDGYVLKKAFDLIQSNNIKTHYLYVSRRALRIPYAAKHSSYEEIMSCFPKTKMLTPRIYLENLGIDANEGKELLHSFGLRLDDDIFYESLFIEERYKKIFEIIYHDIIEGANYEYRILRDYLKQEKFSKKVAVVDVGWHNSMQFYLEQLSEDDGMDYEQFGYYVGMQSGGKKVDHAEAFITDNKKTPYVDSVLAYIGLIESVFLAEEGSTKTYKREGEKIVPVLLDYEYEKMSIENNAFADIKKGINRFIELVCNLPGFSEFKLSGFDAYVPLRSFGINPYLKDIEKFADFKYYSEETVYFANSKPITYYLVNINKLKIDLYKSRWKIGFMKRVFKVSFPYYQIYKILRKM